MVREADHRLTRTGRRALRPSPCRRAHTAPTSARFSVVIAALLTMTPAAARAQDQWQVGLTPSFSSGKYGGDARTEVLYTPITARRLFDAGDITLVFPHTCVRGNEGVTVVNGSVVQTSRTGTRDVRSADRVTRLATTDRRVNTSTSSAALNCGLGDIVVRGRYYLSDGHAWAPTVAVRAHIKAPTASVENGLGTGRPDEGIGLEVTQMLPRGTLVMVDGGYTVIGRPAGIHYNNNWWYDVGIGQSLAGGAVTLSVFFEEYRSIVAGFSNARDVLAAFTFAHPSGWRIQISGEKGLSEGAPDLGFTLGASRRF